MKTGIACLATVTTTLAPLGCAQAQSKPLRSTIVLVHGAFAKLGSWNGVIAVAQ